MHPARDGRLPDHAAAQRLARLDRDGHLRDPARHGAYVAAVFDAVESTYDRFTRVFSLGMDGRWKRDVVARARDGAGPGATWVDLATGTGDLSRAAAAALPGGRVIGLDFSRGMLAAARRRPGTPPSMGLLAGDMMHVPLAAGAADAVTAAYGFRNVSDPAAAASEVFRILRPGGVLVTLDFYRPSLPVWRQLFVGYLGLAGALVGWAWHGVPATYGYIAPSLDRWLTATEFSTLLAKQGFTVDRVSTHLGGGIAIHLARKPSVP